MKLIYIGNKAKAALALLFFATCISSCKKLIEVNAPVTSTNAANVYSSDATATAVLTGIYTNLSYTTFPDGGITSLSLFAGLSADELTLYPGSGNVSYDGYFTNKLTNANTLGTDYWNNFYPTIFVANSAIEGLNNSDNLTPVVKQQLLGEAKFIRAFCYFYLIGLYGDVPLALTTDYKVNSLLLRAPKAQVWQQVIADLKDAQNLLSSNYLKSDARSVYSIASAERVRPNKWAASALLARVYLNTGDYVNAEAQATVVINNSSLYSLNNLNNAFLKNNPEAIWQLQPVLTDYNTQDAQLFVLPSNGPSHPTNPVYLNTRLINAFEAGDQRKVNWVGNYTVGSTVYYYPNKYKVFIPGSPVTEYTMVLRLAEQYLIRAEARAFQNNVAGAQSDLNAIRSRAGLPNTTATTQAALLTAILHERQVELFTEWGHRWLDLKRTNTIDSIMSVVAPQKGSTWNSNWQWYPISLSELQADPNLTQNAGY